MSDDIFRLEATEFGFENGNALELPADSINSPYEDFTPSIYVSFSLSKKSSKINA